ncbi:hypothetical protein P4N68_11535 [Corynebacterium felinum]|uniref:Major Facilitator Superfamily protein n=1 Tax=Corynebacterium felinum TaxID=131318 RepID=A0ABU2B527_9CORY|nr:hypothetical protein [Corynebacterium felinum]MDF5821701.1 hypothetical protein [Corynebacterium felinum]MDR7353715.1 hypothetical protein [Corynebacterium felinum]
MIDDEKNVRTRVWRKVSLIFLTQVFLSTAVGLNLTIVALTAVEVTGRRNLGGLAQTTMILGATIITLVATQVSVRKDRLFSLRCTILTAVFGSILCCISTAEPSRFGAFAFVGFFLLGGGSVSALISRFTAAEKVGAQGPTARAIGIVLFGSACGSAIGPNIYSLVATLTNSLLPFTFLCSAFIFVLSLIPLSFEKRKNYVPLVKDRGIDAKLVWYPQFTAVFLVAIVAHSIMIGLMTMAPIHTDEVFGVSGSSLVMTAHLLARIFHGCGVKR